MSLIEPKPYKLVGKIQNYEWGTKNESAFIPKLLGITVEKDLAYAEYWIGVHPKAPSDLMIGEEKISLIELIKEYPLEILGERVANKFNNTLPFLLKVLSINKALSIQAHPDKGLAKALHAKDPENYPDDNHKPEIALAIDNLKALVGLKSLDEIRESLNSNFEIKNLLTEELVANVNNTNYNNKILTKELYSQIMNAPSSDLEECIKAIKSRLEQKENHSDAEIQFLIQFKNYGVDVGLISILLFNIVNLKEGEAIYTPAGIPHAYIKGNIVECMANSDNVVRAGLTPKYKDLNTLTEMLEVESSEAVVDIYEKPDKITYKTSAEEFEVSVLKLNNEFKVKDNNDIMILLLLEGEINFSYNSGQQAHFKKGDAVVIPASLNNFCISQNKKSKAFMVEIPNN